MSKHVQKELENLQDRLENLKTAKTGAERDRDADAMSAGENIRFIRDKIEHVEAIIEALTDA